MTPFREFVAKAIAEAAHNIGPCLGKIDAIKDIRARTGLGLKASKNLVEAVRGECGWSVTEAALRVVDDYLLETPTAPATPPAPDPEILVMVDGEDAPYRPKTMDEAQRFVSWQSAGHPWQASPRIFLEQV